MPDIVDSRAALQIVHSERTDASRTRILADMQSPPPNEMSRTKAPQS